MQQGMQEGMPELGSRQLPTGDMLTYSLLKPGPNREGATLKYRGFVLDTVKLMIEELYRNREDVNRYKMEKTMKTKEVIGGKEIHSFTFLVFVEKEGWLLFLIQATPQSPHPTNKEDLYLLMSLGIVRIRVEKLVILKGIRVKTTVDGGHYMPNIILNSTGGVPSIEEFQWCKV